MSDSEADLLALMRADRTVQDRRRDAQALKDEEATPDLERVRDRRKKVAP
jgi:hypothetical protein